MISARIEIAIVRRIRRIEAGAFSRASRSGRDAALGLLRSASAFFRLPTKAT